MEKQLINEEIAKVFAMYAPCRMDIGMNIGYRLTYYGIENAVSDGYALILTPLSKISDLDAIEVARIVFSEANDLVVARKDGVVWVNNTKTDEKMVINNHVDRLDPLFLYYWSGNQPQRLGHGYYIDVVDKLRELGYMLPYKGIDLFEAGIAIEKSTC